MARCLAHRRVFVVCFVLLLSSSSFSAWAKAKRALLIGINHYAPPDGAAAVVAPGTHALDSRFAPAVRGPI
jgi:hypothetical protein